MKTCSNFDCPRDNAEGVHDIAFIWESRSEMVCEDCFNTLVDKAHPK